MFFFDQGYESPKTFSDHLYYNQDFFLSQTFAALRSRKLLAQTKLAYFVVAFKLFIYLFLYEAQCQPNGHNCNAFAFVSGVNADCAEFTRTSF